MLIQVGNPFEPQWNNQPRETSLLCSYFVNTAVNCSVATGLGALWGHLFSTVEQGAYRGGSIAFFITNAIFIEKMFVWIVDSCLPKSVINKIDNFFARMFGIRTFKDLETVQEKDWTVMEKIRAVVFPILTEVFFSILAHITAFGISWLCGLSLLNVGAIALSISIQAIINLAYRIKDLVEKIEIQTDGVLLDLLHN